MDGALSQDEINALLSGMDSSDDDGAEAVGEGSNGGAGGAVQSMEEAMELLSDVEKDAVGGTCLNRGCIPTKSLMHCAETYETVKNAASLGITASKVEFDWAKIQSFRQGITDKLVGGVKGLLKMNKVKLLLGTFLTRQLCFQLREMVKLTFQTPILIN